MISVNVSFIGKKISELIVSGHANYDKYGQDLVCAGVSAIMFGGLNALESEISFIEIINQENKLGVIVNQGNDKIEIILETILTQLKTIAESYPKNIKIIHGGV